MADQEAPPPPLRWHYLVRYIDKDGVEQEAEGNLPFINQDSIMRYLGRKYRPLSATGLFKELIITEVTRPYQTKVSEAVSNEMSRPVMNAERMALTQPSLPVGPAAPEKEKFDRKACFIYRYMGQLKTEDWKQHKFYEVVPHY